MTDAKGNREGRLVCLLGFILVFGTLACYWPVRHFNFISLDDSVYVYKTPMVQCGLSWPGFIWAFRSVDGGNWNPLVWLSHMADCQFYGLQPGGHHVTNLLLHTANVLLLFLVFESMTGAIWRSALVAAIFAWHPMHVESVAWIAERKDVLSTLFFLPRHLGLRRLQPSSGGRRRKWFYLLGLCFFTLGLMCKPMLVTFPAGVVAAGLLAVATVGIGGKIGHGKAALPGLEPGGERAGCLGATKRGRRRDSCAAAFRLENAAVSYVTYLGKLFWPAHANDVLSLSRLDFNLAGGRGGRGAWGCFVGW